MNKHSTEISVRARQDELPGLIQAISRMADEFGFPNTVVGKLQLIVEELFLNTIVHGHQSDCEMPVQIRLSGTPRAPRLDYEDSAPAFDPVPAMHNPVIPEQLGGQGLHLVRAMSKSIQYRYENGRNILSLLF